jgi:tetratricopeptide (TPR) repeat protein
MLVSLSNEFLFIHIPKTAGTSVTSALKEYDDLKLAGHHKHRSLQEARCILGANKFNTLFSFAIVRNPWDWMVSLYLYYLRKGVDNPDVHRECRGQGFDYFVDYYSENLKWKQTDWLRLPGNHGLAISSVLRFETLSADFTDLCEKLRISSISLNQENSSGSSIHYSAFYNSTTLRKVSCLLKEDIYRFGYSFTRVMNNRDSEEDIRRIESRMIQCNDGLVKRYSLSSRLDERVKYSQYLLAENNLSEALRVSEALIAKAPSSYDVLMLHSRCLLSKGGISIESAISCLQKATEIDPLSAEALGLLGVACYQLFKYEDAVYHLRSSLELKWDLNILYKLAQSHFYANEYSLCKQAIEEVEPSARTSDIDYLYGLACYRLNLRDEALRGIIRSIEVSPNAHNTYLAGHIYLLCANYKEACSMLERSTSMLPSVHSCYELALAYKHLGKNDQARSSAMESIRIQSTVEAQALIRELH